MKQARRWLSRLASRRALIPLVAVVAVGLAVAVELPRSAALTITPDNLIMINTLESVLLHDTVVPQYGRVTDQDDGGGYRSGVGDFGTADGAALEVVQSYTARVGANALARDYLPTLQTLAASGSAATNGLAGYPQAWQLAGADPVFRQVQDDEMRTRFAQPTLAVAHDLGLLTPLGFAIVYDSLIEHGDAGGPDSLSTMVTRASQSTHGRPGQVGERVWLSAFLSVRLAMLTKPAAPDHAFFWPSTTGRVNALQQLLAAGADRLNPPITVNPYGTAHVLDPASSEIDPDPMETPSPTPAPTSPRPLATGPTHPPATGRPLATTPPPGIPYRQGRVVGIAGLCLDVDGGVPKVGNVIKTWTCNGTDAQSWRTPADGTLRAVGMCLRVKDDATVPDSLAQLDVCDARPSLQWRFVNGTLVNPISGLCLTVPGDSADPGHILQVNTCGDNVGGQRWTPPGTA